MLRLPARNTFGTAVAIVVLIATLSTASASEGAFPGRDGMIAVEVYGFKSGAFSRIYTMNSDGSAVRALTGRLLEAASPTWSPDGRSVAFVGGRAGSGSSAIYVMNADGSRLRRLTSGGAAKGSPTWLPHGRRIAYTVCAPSCSRVRTVDVDGKGRSRIPDVRPFLTIAWSPIRPPRIAFDIEGRGVFVKNLRGGDKSLRLAGRGSQSPGWSPNGRRIVFARFGSRPGIYAANAKSGRQRRLTRSGDDDNPAWSPNGHKIVFARSEALFTVNSNGTGAPRITHDRLFYGAPDWQPLP